MRRALPILALALLPLAAAAAEATLPIEVREGDTLWRLSNEVFAGPAAWREVARLNRLPDGNRIYPGQVLNVPQRLLRTDPVAARLVGVEGDVRVDGRPASAGTILGAGQALTTAGNASAVVELDDGSRVRVQPASEAGLAQSARVGARPDDDGFFAGTMRLVRGSLEVLAARLLRAKPLEVQSPTAVIGVRGTEYRVHHGDDLGTRTEVLEGLVRADPAGRPEAGVDVAMHYGAAVGGPAAAAVLRPLPPGPALGELPGTFERPVVRFAVPGEATALRVQVAHDERFERIVSDERLPAGAEVRIAGLPDGDWSLRVRRVDASGIEGLDSTHRFTLAARPEPPAPSAPRAGGQVGAGTVWFTWAESLEAQHYHLQVARDAAFTQLVFADPQIVGPRIAVHLPQAGNYHWRIASVRPPQGERRTQGPWSDPQALTVRAAPPAAGGGLSSDGRQLDLRWTGRPEDRQQVELARDEGFTQGVVRAELDAPNWTLPRPEQPGTYYFRYRSVEPDGFVTPFSGTLKLEIERDWRGLWLLGVPLLFVL
ncbi:FecR domain-containing protein [Aquincola sp. MAHUQ-54]|uniref:FecR domain-containing protein n=1 Tax=Aquincola agrisoli TaxID=3119538 RepID=A0AAW9QGH4_9BURK